MIQAELSSKFGTFGGRYVPETLMPSLLQLETSYTEAAKDRTFQDDFRRLVQEYSGRPTPLYFARRLTEHLGSGRIYLKREDLNHTGAHKLNNVIGQVLLAKRMGKKRIIAETGAGQHGVATATVCAMMGLACEVYMGAKDVKRQSLNVFRMNLLGAAVHSVSSGTATLKDATNEAIRDWVGSVEDTFYVIGSVVGPHPYPTMVRDFQRIIGDEAKEQIMACEGRLPDLLVACVGGGSNAMGLFYPFIQHPTVGLLGVEAAGLGLHTPHHAATLTLGSPGVLHGMLTKLLQDEDGQIAPVHSLSAGLDYPGVGPEHASLQESGRAEYMAVTDSQALEGFQLLSKLEGILPALESAHAIAGLMERAHRTTADQVVVVNLSGRGDKDVTAVFEALEGEGAHEPD